MTSSDVTEITKMIDYEGELACARLADADPDDADIFEYITQIRHNYQCYLRAMSDLCNLMSADDSKRLDRSILDNMTRVRDAYYATEEKASVR